MANIPVPQARYELLKDNSIAKHITTKKKLCLISTSFLLSTTIVGIMLLIVNYNYFMNNFMLPYYYRSSEFPKSWVERAVVYNSACPNASVDYKPIEATTTRSRYHPKDVQNYKLVCYYTVTSNMNELQAVDIDPFLCTHIIVGFALVHNQIIWIDEDMNKTLLDTVDLKKKNKNLKVLVSLGGAGNDDGFPEMVYNHSTRKIFIKSLVSVIKEYRLDGIDLDWEFPNEHQHGDKKQKMHFTQLLREIREEINRHAEKRKFLLTIAVGAPPVIVDNSYDVMYINDNVDFINLMTYDFHFYTRYSPFTGINAPLYEKTGELGYLATLNINYSAHYWHQKGIDKSKIIIGLPLYGHTFELMNPENFKIGAPASGYGKLGNLGFISYPDVCWFLSNYHITPIFDLDTKSPYAYKTNEWISYDDGQSLSYKTEFIKSNEFGGAMVLSLNVDDYKGTCGIKRADAVSFPLTRKVKDVMYDDQL